MQSKVVISAYNVYIKPTYVVTMPEFSGLSGRRTSKQKANESNLSDNKHNGQLSKKSLSKLRNAINWLTVSAKYKRVYCKSAKANFWFKINFITLTIPPQSGGVVSEQLFKKALHTWIQYARKYYYLKNYVWKVEAHEDGRLHVHLSTDTFIHYSDARRSWNKVLFNYGLLGYHFQQFGNYNPPSTDIHAVRKVNDVAAYLATYMVKSASLPASYKGRIWSCNYELSHSHQCKLNIDSTEMAECMRTLVQKQIRYAAIESPPDALGARKKIGEIFFLNPDLWSKYVRGAIRDEYDKHRFKIRQGAASPPLDYMVVDKFSDRTIQEYIKKVKPVKSTQPCETKKSTPKIGQMRFDLPS